MEKKKLTRDQHLIKLIRESAEKDLVIKGLEKDKKDHEKRLKKLEEGFRRLKSLVDADGKTIRVLKEKSSNHEHGLSNINQTLRRKST